MKTFKNLHEALLFRKTCPVCKNLLTEKNICGDKTVQFNIESFESFTEIACGTHYCMSLIKHNKNNEVFEVIINFEMFNIIKDNFNYTIILTDDITEISKKETDNSSFHEEMVFPKKIEDNEIYDYINKYNKFLVVS